MSSRRKRLSDAELLEFIFSRCVRSTETGCLEWSGHAHRLGYGFVSYRGRDWLAHRLVLTLLGRGPLPGDSVLHKCDNPKCCEPEHLRVGTHADNMADMASKGRVKTCRGSAHTKSKLTEDQVRSIRGDSRIAALVAVEYGISKALVSHIKTRRNWSHLPD